MMNNILMKIFSIETLLFIVTVIVVIDFFYLLYRNYHYRVEVDELDQRVRDLIDGDFGNTINLEDKIETLELSSSLNDLTYVIKNTQDNLSQEKNRLDSILSYMTDGVMATDRRGKVIMINEMASRLLNISRQEALNKDLIELLESDTAYSYHDLITKTPELTIYRQDAYDEYITLRVNFALIKRDSGFVSGLVVVLHDITEQDKEERERRLFVSNVSHELRTPLTSVKSYLEALDEGALTETVAPSFIKVSLDETNRMMRMITDLLNLSRIDNQTSHLDVELVNFTSFMSSIINRFDRIRTQQLEETGDKTFEIIREYPLVPIWVEIDTDKMTQVFENIINNAIKYSPDGGKIVVDIQTTDAQLIVSISDEGLGIPKKDLPLIFDRFYRVDKARSREQGGTGLGLAISKEIVKQHNGYIWAKSQEGEGSTFTVVLPYENIIDLDVVEEEWDEALE